MSEFFTGLFFFLGIAILREAGRYALSWANPFWRGPGSGHLSLRQKGLFLFTRVRDYRLTPMETASWGISSALAVSALSVLPLDGRALSDGLVAGHAFVVCAAFSLVIDSLRRAPHEMRRRVGETQERAWLSLLVLLLLLFLQHAAANFLGPEGWGLLFVTPWMATRSIAHAGSLLVMLVLLALLRRTSVAGGRWLDSSGVPARAQEIALTTVTVLLFAGGSERVAAVFIAELALKVLTLLLTFDLIDVSFPKLRSDFAEFVTVKIMFPVGVALSLGVWALGGQVPITLCFTTALLFGGLALKGQQALALKALLVLGFFSAVVLLRSKPDKFEANRFGTKRKVIAALLSGLVTAGFLLGLLSSGFQAAHIDRDGELLEPTLLAAALVFFFIATILRRLVREPSND